MLHVLVIPCLPGVYTIYIGMNNEVCYANWYYYGLAVVSPYEEQPENKMHGGSNQ